MFPKLMAAVLLVITIAYLIYYGYEFYLHPFDVLRPMLYFIPIGILWLIFVAIA